MLRNWCVTDRNGCFPATRLLHRVYVCGKTGSVICRPDRQPECTVNRTQHCGRAKHVTATQLSAHLSLSQSLQFNLRIDFLGCSSLWHVILPPSLFFRHVIKILRCDDKAHKLVGVFFYIFLLTLYLARIQSFNCCFNCFKFTVWPFASSLNILLKIPFNTWEFFHNIDSLI